MPASAKLIHFVSYGVAACMKPGPPKDWPPDHLWSSRWQEVTCRDCLKGQPYIDTFTLTTDGGITCLRCKATSYNPNDVEQHYCGRCHVHHDDLWPPSRQWWIDHPNPIPS